MKDEWQNRDLEFDQADENPEDEYGYDEDFEDEPEEIQKARTRPPSNKKDFRVKHGGHGTIDPGKTNSIALTLNL
mgnify:CR=1 FL=1